MRSRRLIENLKGVSCGAWRKNSVPDHSALDDKYFIDNAVYNCPYCNRRHVSYTLAGVARFDWTDAKPCWLYLAQCDSCKNTSLHLSFEEVHYDYGGGPHFDSSRDLDDSIFYSVPTSFFVMDSRVPRVLRELITEAEGCLKMNFLTGASACTRKAIYELTVLQKAQGGNYDERIRDIEQRFPDVDSEYFEVLRHIKDMTSDKVHEQSWDKWDSSHLKLFLETLRSILHEIYVTPDERSKRVGKIRSLIPSSKKTKSAE